jgi:hypothetical protein
MIVTGIVIAVLVYLAFHLGAGHPHHGYRKAHGLRPNFHWSSVRRPYASIRLPGGFRVGHRP